METILELKQFCKDRIGTNFNEIFYIYNIDGNIIWFTQYQQSGHIYSVGIGVKEEYSKYFHFCPFGDKICFDYPTDAGLNINGMRVDGLLTYKYVDIINYAVKLKEAIEELLIGKDSIHYNLYREKHNSAL